MNQETKEESIKE